MSGYACGDAGWRSEPPKCDCRYGGYGADVDAYPPRPHIHVSKRFDGVSRDCSLYVWHHGCDFLGKITGRACPHKGCSVLIAYCKNHGGDERAVREMWEHVKAAHACTGMCG